MELHECNSTQELIRKLPRGIDLRLYSVNANFTVKNAIEHSKKVDGKEPAMGWQFIDLIYILINRKGEEDVENS